MIMVYFSISRHLLMAGNLSRGTSLVLVLLVTIKMINRREITSELRNMTKH